MKHVCDFCLQPIGSAREHADNTVMFMAQENKKLKSLCAELAEALNQDCFCIAGSGVCHICKALARYKAEVEGEK